MKNKNELWDADRVLFESQLIQSQSPAESNFFLNMRYKEEYEPTLSNDLIMSENDNSLGIYIVRINYDEYVVGCKAHHQNELHVMNLYEALNIQLKDIGLDSPLTIGKWLQDINYRGVKYNMNFDNI